MCFSPTELILCLFLFINFSFSPQCKTISGPNCSPWWSRPQPLCVLSPSRPSLSGLIWGSCCLMWWCCVRVGHCLFSCFFLLCSGIMFNIALMMSVHSCWRFRGLKETSVTFPNVLDHMKDRFVDLYKVGIYYCILNFSKILNYRCFIGLFRTEVKPKLYWSRLFPYLTWWYWLSRWPLLPRRTLLATLWSALVGEGLFALNCLILDFIFILHRHRAPTSCSFGGNWALCPPHVWRPLQRPPYLDCQLCGGGGHLSISVFFAILLLPLSPRHLLNSLEFTSCVSSIVKHSLFLRRSITSSPTRSFILAIYWPSPPRSLLTSAKRSRPQPTSFAGLAWRATTSRSWSRRGGWGGWEITI